MHDDANDVTACRCAVPNQSIDVLPIDGNHDRRQVAGDVRRWLPKLRRDGIVGFDDTSWATVRPVVSGLTQRGRLLVDASDISEDFMIVEVK